MAIIRVLQVDHIMADIISTMGRGNDKNMTILLAFRKVHSIVVNLYIFFMINDG